MNATTIWRDDFEPGAAGSCNNGIKSCNWVFQEGDGEDYGIPGWGNEELQVYQSGPDVASVVPDPCDPSKGHLAITAIKHSQPVLTPNNRGRPPTTKLYTSARLTTKGRHSFGWNTLANPSQSLFVEARVKLPSPSANGLWPAIWMLPADRSDWPEGGEIDILEAKNEFLETTTALHFKGAHGHHQFAPGGGALQNKDQFHVWGMEWSRSKIRVYVDDRTLREFQVEEWNKWYAARGDPEGPFNKPFYILINLAVGGRYTGLEPSQIAVERSQMLVDWVHVYTKGSEGGIPGPVHPGPTPVPEHYEVVAFRFTQHNPDSSSLVRECYTPDTSLASMFTSYLPSPYKIVLAMTGRAHVDLLPPEQQGKGYGRLWALLAPVGVHIHRRMVGGRTEAEGADHVLHAQWGSDFRPELGMQAQLVATFLGQDARTRKIWAYFDNVGPSRQGGCVVHECVSPLAGAAELIGAGPPTNTSTWGPGIMCWSSEANNDVPCDFHVQWSAWSNV